MKFSTDKAHRDYFYKHGMIEFDQLFNEGQIKELNQAIHTILLKEIPPNREKLPPSSSDGLFKVGRDLWRKNESIQKLILHKRLAEVAIELMEVKSLRMGYDQLFFGEQKPIDSKNPYHQLLMQTGSLQDISCLKPVICGLMICLEDAQSDDETSPLFSKKAGNGVFFKPEIPMDLQYLTHATKSRYLLIAFVDSRTVYVLNDRDPNTHELKRLGYVFGDRLTDSLHPLLHR